MASESFEQLCKDIEKLKIADILDKVKQAVIFLQETEDLTTKNVYFALQFMKESYFLGRKESANEARKNGLANQFVKIAQSLESTINSPDENKREFQNLDKFLVVFGNYANASPEFGVDFAKHGGVDCVISLMKRMDTKNSSKYMGLLLHCLLNSIRHDECAVNREVYRKAGAVEVLKKLLISSESTLALLTLSFIINEEESEFLGRDNETIEYFVKLLKQAALTKNHTAFGDNVVESTVTYDLVEIANGLMKLIVNDANKKVVFKNSGIEVMNTMLADGFSSEEQTIAAKLVWSLSFDEDVQKSDVIKESVEALTRLSESNDRHVSSVCKDALWQISEGSSGESKKKSEAASSSCKENGHIMISYNWSHQHVVLKIRDELVAAGYTVWIDVDKMGGDILESMADAVTKSSIILLCMTQQYHASQSCRSEASYAFKKKKVIIPLLLEVDYKPEGWLDFLIGTKLYYKLCSDLEMKKNMDEVKKAISRQFMPRGGISEIDGEPVKPTKSKTTSSDKISDAISWSNERVLVWFDEIKLPQLKDVLDFCDGSGLSDIYERSCRDMGAFEEDCKSNFGLKYSDILRFKAGLKKIF